MLSASLNNNTFNNNVISVKVNNIVNGVSANVSFCVPVTGKIAECGLDNNCDGIIEPCIMPLPLPLTPAGCTCCCVGSL